jgi:alginate O-acetyltransferase complex protein AlgI
MSFLSISYFALLAVTAVLLRLLPTAWRPSLLLAASLGFYAASGVSGFALMLVLTAVNFLFYRALLATEEGLRRHLLLGLAVFVNLSCLVGFKYLRGLISLGFPGNGEAVNWAATWVAPLGISFLTIQLIGACIDAAQCGGERIRTFGEFMRFIFFFPQMTIGPIGRTGTLVPELRTLALPDSRDLAEGVAQILRGVFKKCVVADRLGVYVAAVYQPDGLHYGAVPVLLAILLYPLQIYADFSGYSDIAIGSARVLGVRIPENFDRPFAAPSVTEFWRRWHISFSSWLRDYLYMPIFIQMRGWGKVGMVLSLLVTFVLCGLWHGLSWMFFLFGIAHGLALCAEGLTKSQRRKVFVVVPFWLFHAFGVVYTYLFYSLSMVLFRSESLASAWAVLHRVLSAEKIQGWNEVFAYRGPFLFLLTLMSVGLLLWIERPVRSLVTDRRAWLIPSVMAVLILWLGKGAGQDFIYAQF